MCLLADKQGRDWAAIMDEIAQTDERMRLVSYRVP